MDWGIAGLKGQASELGMCPAGTGKSRKTWVGEGKMPLAFPQPVISHQPPGSLLSLPSLSAPETCQPCFHLRAFALAVVFAWRGKGEDL